MTVIFSLLSINQTLANNKPYDPKLWETETLIAEGEESPRRGVLVPEYNYRIYQKGLERWENVEPLLLEVARDDQYCETDYKLHVVGFTLGLSLGLIAGVLVLK